MARRRRSRRIRVKGTVKDVLPGPGKRMRRVPGYYRKIKR